MKSPRPQAEPPAESAAHWTRIEFRFPPQPDRISAIVPVRDDAQGLRCTLASLQRQLLSGPPLEIIVANDGDSDAVAAVCRQLGVAWLGIAPAAGSYFARNRALEYASGEIIAFIDADIEVPENWLQRAMGRLGEESYLAGAVAIQGGPPATATAAFEKRNAFPIANYLRQGHFGGAGNLLLRRTLIEAVGGFDPRLQSGGDAEFGKRIFHRGFAQAYLEEPALLHPQRTLGQFLAKVKRLRSGQRLRHRLHPDLFPPAPAWGACLAQLLAAILPPRPSRLRENFAPDDGVSTWRKYGFLWLKKAGERYFQLRFALQPPPFRARFDDIVLRFHPAPPS